MRRQSFARWHFPRDLEGVLLHEDVRQTAGRLGIQERHFHDELELHFIERGRGLFLLSNQRLAASEGTLIWVPPGREHLLLEVSDDFRRWTLLSRKRLVRRVLPAGAHTSLLGKAACEQVRQLSPRAALGLRQSLRDARAEQSTPRSIANAGVAFALARCFTLFEGASSADTTPITFHPAVSQALSLLREDALSLPQLAHRAQVSESHLSKLFMSQVGVSVTEFRNRLGLERFVAIYGDGSRLTLTAAALAAGFGSYPHFHRTFRRHFGHAPAGHRARQHA